MAELKSFGPLPFAINYNSEPEDMPSTNGCVSGDGIDRINQYLRRVAQTSGDIHRVHYPILMKDASEFYYQKHIAGDAISVFSELFTYLMPSMDPINFTEELKNFVGVKTADTTAEDIKKAFIAFFNRYDPQFELRGISTSNMWEDIGYSLTSTESHKGTLARRIVAFFNKQGHKLTNRHVEMLGNLASADSSKVTNWKVSFHRDYLEATDRDYLNPGSCWWNCDNNARHIMYRDGGYGVKFWVDGKLVSRCWVIKSKYGLLVFNSYGTMNLMFLANSLAGKFGLKVQKTYLACDEIYVNNNSAYILHDGNTELASEIRISKRIKRCGCGNYILEPNQDQCSKCNGGDYPEICYK